MLEANVQNQYQMPVAMPDANAESQLGHHMGWIWLDWAYMWLHGGCILPLSGSKYACLEGSQFGHEGCFSKDATGCILLQSGCLRLPWAKEQIYNACCIWLGRAGQPGSREDGQSMVVRCFRVPNRIGACKMYHSRFKDEACSRT